MTILMADGGEMALLALLVPYMAKEWSLTHFQQGLMGGSHYIGSLIGAILSGRISDIYGRKPTFVLGMFFVSAFAILSSLSTSFYYFFLFRILYGMGIGLSIPACSTLTTEITPKRLRARILNAIWLFFPIGEIYAILFSRYYLTSKANTLLYELTSWRALIITVGIPSFFSFFLSFFVDESPRYYFTNGFYEKGMEKLNNILRANMYIELTESEKSTLKNEASLIRQNTESFAGKGSFFENYKRLFSRKYMGIIVCLLVLKFVNYASWNGLSYLMPQAIFRHREIHDKSIMYHLYLISAICELPAMLLCIGLNEFKVIGRKKALNLGFFLCLVTLAAACVNLYKRFIRFGWLISTCRFLCVIPYGSIFIVINEAFPTKIRTTAIGTLGSIGRTAGAIVPSILQIMLVWEFNSPFIFLAALLLIGWIVSFVIPIDDSSGEKNIE